MSYENKEHTLSFSTKNADMNGDVMVTVNGKLRDIKKYMGSIKNLEYKTDEYEAKAKAFDRIAKIYTLFKAEHRSTIPTDDESLDFAIDISEIIDEYENGESDA